MFIDVQLKQSCEKKGSTNVSKVFYSADAFYQQRLRDFVLFGENKINTHTLLTAYATEINDGPKDEPLGIRRKLPPFKGWKDLDL